MATKRQKIEVGVLLTVVIGATTFVFLFLAGVRGKHLDRYYLEFEENIAGLTEGSKVTYRGVPVGKIIDLVVTSENRVGITIGVDPMKVTLREGVRARYTIESLFGPYVIDLSGGNDQSVTSLEPGTTIPVERSLLAGLEATFSETVPLTLQRTATLMERLDKVLANITPDDIPRVLRGAEEALANANRAITDFRTRTDGIADQLEKSIGAARAEIERTGDKAAEALDELRDGTQATAESTQRVLESLEGTIEENRKPLAASLRQLDEALAGINRQLEGLELPATSKAVREAAGKVGTAADSVTKGSDAVVEARGDLHLALADLRRELTRTLGELDRSLRSARELIRALERDPSALLRGKHSAK